MVQKYKKNFRIYEKKLEHLYFNLKHGGEIDMTHTCESEERKTRLPIRKRKQHTRMKT